MHPRVRISISPEESNLGVTLNSVSINHEIGLYCARAKLFILYYMRVSYLCERDVMHISYLNFNKIKNNLGFTIIIVHLESFRVNTLLYGNPRIIAKGQGLVLTLVLRKLVL